MQPVINKTKHFPERGAFFNIFLSLQRLPPEEAHGAVSIT
jgi:hypothetical protein